jgi:hypothetical protein
MEPRVLNTIDVDSGESMKLNVLVETTSNKSQSVNAPGLLPELSTIKKILITTSNDKSNMEGLYFPKEMIISSQPKKQSRKEFIVGSNSEQFDRLSHSDTIIPPLYIKRKERFVSSCYKAYLQKIDEKNACQVTEKDSSNKSDRLHRLNDVFTALSPLNFRMFRERRLASAINETPSFCESTVGLLSNPTERSELTVSRTLLSSDAASPCDSDIGISCYSHIRSIISQSLAN